MLTLSSDLDTICNVVNDVVPNLEEVGKVGYRGTNTRILKQTDACY